MFRRFLSMLGLVAALAGNQAYAQPVGEMHRVTTSPSAAFRDEAHRPEVRMTIWYPASPDSVERPIVIVPESAPLIRIGQAAADAKLSPEGGRLPVILLSHGFGGTARIMGWFGIAMARNGYIVIAVDHPGNNSLDPITIAGASLFWQRADDLRAAFAAASADPIFGPRMDADRIGVAGMSAGGATALIAAGARADVARLMAFCQATPEDGVCRPQREFQIRPEDRAAFLSRPEVIAESEHAGDDRSVAGVRAVFLMAPAIIQGLAPDSLGRIHVPVALVLGDADVTAPPATNGVVAAQTIPGASLTVLPGVGHYDFLSPCTEAGRAAVALCQTAVPQTETHQRTIALATAFFGKALLVAH